MKTFLELLYAIAVGYVINSWPFLIAHLFVTYLVRNSWKQLTRERLSLERWNSSSIPSEISTADGSSPLATPNNQERPLQTILVLERFIAESRTLGAKGIFVPMTDFSDRLDSAVEGKIAELHDRTNLFLYVGIAGTMFGVFEFALRSYNLLVATGVEQSVKVTELAKYLSGSMSKAFPVGFFGLVFTFVAQILATRPEHRLREELSEAARKALETRQGSIQSQAELMEKAANSIAAATEPLRDLKTTLSEGLQPLVDVFGKRLDKTLELVQEHFTTVEKTSTSLESAVENLRQAVDTIVGATASLQSLIKETPKIISRLVELEKKHERSLQNVDRLFLEHFQQADKVSKTLEATINQLPTLSNQILTQAAEAIHQVETAAASAWSSSADGLRQKIESDLESIFINANRKTGELTESVRAAIETVNRVGQSSEAALMAIAKIAPQIAEGYTEATEKVATESVSIWKEKTDQFVGDTETAYLSYLAKIEKGTAASFGALENAANAWDEVARDVPRTLREPVQAAVDEARKDLIKNIESFDTNVARRIKEFSTELNALHNSTAALVENVQAINSGLGNWVKRVGPFLKEIENVTDGMKQQNRVQEKLVKRLDSTSDVLERTVNRLAAQKPRQSQQEPGRKTVVVREEDPRKWWNPFSWKRKR